MPGACFFGEVMSVAFSGITRSASPVSAAGPLSRVLFTVSLSNAVADFYSPVIAPRVDLLVNGSAASLAWDLGETTVKRNYRIGRNEVCDIS